jgi:four helix bundle protein
MVFSVMPYEKFDAWRLAHELALEVYRITDAWPKHELFGLTAQTRRAALSVPTNIAEGAAKRGNGEFGRYLDIALGSSSELCYLLRFSNDRGLLNGDTWKSLEARRERASILLWRLYRSVRRSTRSK